MQGGNNNKIIYADLSYRIVGILYEVYNKLGYGYKEVIYQKAIENELAKHKIKFRSQLPYSIRYNGSIIGRRYLDFLIEEKIILEIKKGDYYVKENYNQVFEYLKLSKLQLAIISNFTSNGVKCKRIVNSIM